MERIKIDLVPNGVMPTAHASQFDVGRTIRFYLTDNGADYTLAGTETITLDMTAPDGTEMSISLTNTSSNYVEWTTDDGELNIAGAYLAEIVITSGTDVLGSANFVLKVEEDAYNGKNIRVVTVGYSDICTFTPTLTEPLVSLKTSIVPSQSGSGTPSPSNPRPLISYTEANITANGTTYTIDLDGTRYGGTLDVTTGTLTVTHTKKKVLSSMNFQQVSGWDSNSYFIGDFFTDGKEVSGYDTIADLVCNISTIETPANIANGMNGIGQSGRNIYINLGVDLATLKDYCDSSDGFEITYELATPVVVSVDSVRPFANANIVNNVFADVGQTEVKYLTEG